MQGGFYRFRLWMNSPVAIKIKPIELYFHVLLFVMPYKFYVTLSFQSVDETDGVTF